MRETMLTDVRERRLPERNYEVSLCAMILAVRIPTIGGSFMIACSPCRSGADGEAPGHPETSCLCTDLIPIRAQGRILLRAVPSSPQPRPDDHSEGDDQRD